MIINITFWYRVKLTGVIADGVPTCLEVTPEQYKKIEESYKAGKYKYMTDDPGLKEICQPLIEEGNTYGPDWYKEHFAKFEIVAEYPDMFVADCGGIQLERVIIKSDLGGEEK